ncbi:MAG TPA: hypothetical protein H9836_08525 [Candidatus Nocardiopsis merdipullorum]|nr:hypothetical protein [Candidatus Nocardiopsis merdipullorum]
MPEPSHIQIGEVVERIGAPLRTNRYCGEVGSMEPSARSRGGFRLHTETDVDKSTLIERRNRWGSAWRRRVNRWRGSTDRTRQRSLPKSAGP